MEELSPRLSSSGMTEESSSPSSFTAARVVNTNAIDLSSPENCRFEVLPFQSFSPGFRSSDQTIQDFNNFKKGAAPSRFLFFRNDTWVDFPDEVFEALRTGFIQGQTTLEYSINGDSYIVDFLRMIQINSSTKVQNSIAWIDVEGHCFFPKTVLIQEQRKVPCSKVEIGISIDKRDSFISSEEHSDETPGDFGWPRWPGVELLREGDRFFKVVEKLFLAGIRRLVPNTVVTSIYKCSHSGLIGNSRLRAFQMMIGVMKEVRGDANVKFGWYGASKEDVGCVVEHGFGKPNNGGLGFNAHGIGVHLSPPHSPYSSCLLSEADDGGERHIILCRVIMGNSERVEPGSVQYHPSSEEFDSGVDDLVNPKWYVVWSTHMNTHILPEYVVSFKSSKQSQGTHRAVSSARRPLVTGLSFSKLLAEMERSLPSSRKQALEILYNQHKAGQMSKDTFIRYLRSTVGDNLLASTIRKIRGH